MAKDHPTGNSGLYRAFLQLKTPEECYRFLQDVCSYSELSAMEQRYNIAELLADKRIYTEIMDKTDKWTVPLFALFFVISGAELELNVFSDPAIIGIGAAYILSRSAGKYIGAFSSCKMAKCDEKTTRYLGVTLLPQAGVALGMSVTVMELGDIGSIIRNIILFSVLVYELLGPVLTKIALTKAGDITEKPKEKERKHRTPPAKIN